MIRAMHRMILAAAGGSGPAAPPWVNKHRRRRAGWVFA